MKQINNILDSMPLVSIYTCVYNGEKTIHRVFNSIKKITYPNIEHVIVNDGSTDKTEQLVEEYIKQVSFPVKYYKKENGGKHTALNVAWEIASGDFLVQLDADDELLPHSISYLLDTYYRIPEDVRDEYWCVGGRCVTQYGDFVGDRYPDNINNNNWRNAGEIASTCRGDKVGFMVRKYLSEYKFPEVIGLSHIPEGLVWNQINRKYGTWYTNEIVRVYYVNEGGNLTAKITRRSQLAPMAYYYKWQITHPDIYGNPTFKKMMIYSLCFFTAHKKYRAHNKYFDGINNHKFILSLLYPAMFFGSILFRMWKGIK